MSTTSPFIGSFISLISKSEIRYEGFLYAIDTVESTVALASVRSFGTEGRRPGDEIPPSENDYDYIIFKGSDVKDLTVCEAPRAQETPIAMLNANSVPVDNNMRYSEYNYNGNRREPFVPHPNPYLQQPPMMPMNPYSFPPFFAHPHGFVPPYWENSGMRFFPEANFQYPPGHQIPEQYSQNYRYDLPTPVKSSIPYEKNEPPIKKDVIPSAENPTKSFQVNASIANSVAKSSDYTPLIPNFERIEKNVQSEHRTSHNANSSVPNGRKQESKLGEFDFIASNAKFLRNEGHIPPISGVSCYEKTSFFDNISCESNSDKNRRKWQQERRTNLETFGRVAAGDPKFSGRGGYRGRSTNARSSNQSTNVHSSGNQSSSVQPSNFEPYKSQKL